MKTANKFFSAEELDPLFNDAAKVIIDNDNASASFLQRKMSLGYARAARILDELHMAGVIGPADGAKPREVYFKTYEELKLKQPQLIQSINVEKLREKEGPFPPITQHTLLNSHSGCNRIIPYYRPKY
jgi:hypothetical protein